jgi:hypothetical protein
MNVFSCETFMIASPNAFGNCVHMVININTPVQNIFFNPPNHIILAILATSVDPIVDLLPINCIENFLVDLKSLNCIFRHKLLRLKINWIKLF